MNFHLPEWKWKCYCTNSYPPKTTAKGITYIGPQSGVIIFFWTEGMVWLGFEIFSFGGLDIVQNSTCNIMMNFFDFQWRLCKQFAWKCARIDVSLMFHDWKRDLKLRLRDPLKSCGLLGWKSLFCVIMVSVIMKRS